MPEQTVRRKKRRIRPARVIFALIFVAALFTGIGLLGREIYKIAGGMHRIAEEPTETTIAATMTTTTTTTTLFPQYATRTTSTVALADPTLIYGDTALLIAVHPEGNEILAERNAEAEVYPASMTKVMTLLTFFKLGGRSRTLEMVEMEHDVLTFAWQNEASCAGFMEYERVRVIDLLYGMMLPSGADAALTLAKITAGSEAAFVKEMNAYAAEMGLHHSHFMNCTGLHDPQHYCSAQDVAIMIGLAMQDPLCRKLMSTREYITMPTTHHPKGLKLTSTIWSRTVPDALTVRYGLPITVMGGKTGFTDEAGQCLATWAEDSSGNRFITVIAGCPPKEPYQAVDDTMTLYMMAMHAFDPPVRYTPTETTTTETTTTTTTTDTETTVSADSTETVTTASAAMQ